MNPEAVPLIQEVQQIANERVPAEDFQQQVDRWNRYQAGLDKIQHQCQIENVRFRRRLTTSYSERRIRNIKQAVAVGLISFMIHTVIVGYQAYVMYETPVSIYSILQERADPWALAQTVLTGSITIGVMMAFLAGTLILNRGKLPEQIKFQCKPIINIDDLYYLQRFVKGMAKERHDPKVVLPELTMQLPQSWIKQQSLLSVMDTMKGIKL